MEGGLLQVGCFQDPLLVSCANQSLQKLLKRQMEDLLRGGKLDPRPLSNQCFIFHIHDPHQQHPTKGRKEGGMERGMERGRERFF